MRNILFLIVFAICSFAQAQETLKNNEPTDTSSTYLIKLTDNTTLSGKILHKTENEIIFYDMTIGKVTFQLNKIQNIKRLSEDQLCIITTINDKTFTGYLISQNINEITLKTESLGTLTISNSKIKNIKLIEKEQLVNGQFYFSNPHSTRYFFGPTAVPLKKGEGYYQNAYILANSVQVGVSDHFSMGGGVGIPILFFITPKIGYKVGESIYAGGGLLVAGMFTSNSPFGLGIGYGSLTLGNLENNFTISTGWGAMKRENITDPGVDPSYDWKLAERPMFTFSGMARIAAKVSLVSENWVFALKDNKYDNNGVFTGSTIKYHSVLTFGFRIMGEKNSFDLALAIPSIGNDEFFGFPYLDYVFKF